MIELPDKAGYANNLVYPINTTSNVPFNQYQTILDKMIDETIEKSGYKNLADQIEKWNRDPYLLRISVDKDELLLLRWSISTRNIIIHNNAKINKDHYILTEQVAVLKNAKSELDPVGSKLILESVSLSGVYLHLYRIVEQVYSAVVGKYFPNTSTNN